MRRFGCAVAAAATLAVAGCGVPGEAISAGQTPGTTSTSAAPVIEQDTVHELMIGGADAPVKVLFGRHAAIYQLNRNNPNFAAWLAILQTAHDQGTQVRFAYDVYGPTLTLVEPAQ